LFHLFHLLDFIRLPLFPLISISSSIQYNLSTIRESRMIPTTPPELRETISLAVDEYVLHHSEVPYQPTTEAAIEEISDVSEIHIVLQRSHMR
jgi:hypothetical protein